MKKTKRTISVLLIAAMLFTILPSFSVAHADGTVFSVESGSGRPGKEVEVNLSISGNPGISTATLKISFSDDLTLVGAEQPSYGAFKDLGKVVVPFQLSDEVKEKGKVSSPCKFTWASNETTQKDGVVLKLTFLIAEDASLGDELPITIEAEEITNADLDISCTFTPGKIKVIDFTPGDVDDIDDVDPYDVVLICRYIVDDCTTDPNGYNISINEAAADVNADNKITTKDAGLICRYIADGCRYVPKSYGVKLLPSSLGYSCTHNLSLVEAKAATCVAVGNTAYWECTKCHKLFSDANGETVITAADTVVTIDPDNHANVVIDAAVAATQSSTGLTEGSHCEACHKVIVAREVTPVLEKDTASITYNLVNASKDPYLAQQSINNNCNKDSYVIGEELKLSNDLNVDGYTFVGWFDSFDDSAAQIKEIPATAKNNITLFAHWKENTYDITYNLYQTPVESAPTEEQKHFTVSKGNYNLYNPKINNYIFLGWYDDNGVEYKNIPVGTTTDIILNAYYTSERNLAVSKTDNNPIILEDRDNNVVYFTYEIGEIRNIPLNADSPFWTIQSVAGLSQTKSETYTTTITESEASSVSKVISDMTVNSNTWTLAETWNDVTTVDSTWAETLEKTSEVCKTEATTTSNTLSVSEQNGGSSYHKTEDGTTVYDYDSKTETTDKGHEFNASIDGNYTNKTTANLGASTESGASDSFAYTSKSKGNTSSDTFGSSDKDTFSAGVSYENGFEANAGLSYGYHNNTNTVTKTGSDSVTVNSEIDESTGTWNRSASFSATNQHSVSQSVRNTLSDIVTTTKSYGSSYSNGGTDSSTQGFSSTNSSTAGTTSSVTYSKTESKTTTTTYSVDGKIEGKYRSVLAGTAHVFGVVGYDYNTKSYFAYTFSVMDDKTEEFLDYTPKTGNFDDCENSCLPFEIPRDIFDYVTERTVKTKGVSYRTNSINGTAVITGYNGTSTDVVIPSYVSDGAQAYKVTSITSKAFDDKKTNIRAVVLGEFIEEIPDGAFKNCTNLEGIIGSFSKIGDEAFSGCGKLTNLCIPSDVSKIGTNAFNGVGGVTVRVMNSLTSFAEAVKTLPNGIGSEDAAIKAEQRTITRSFIDSILNSGANNITLDLSKIIDGTRLNLVVPECNSVEINGASRTYSDFSLESNAKNTTLKSITASGTDDVPLRINSDKLTLHKAFISGENTVLVLTKEGAELLLNQDSSVTTSSDEYAVIAKNPVIKAMKSSDGADGYLNVCGDFAYAGTIKGEENLEFIDGKLHELTDDEYNMYKYSYLITFDANEGKTETTSMRAYLGYSVGLPTPTREGYDFSGWFTKDGTEIKDGKEFTTLKNVTLYAHWTPKQFTVVWEEADNVTITVTRTSSPIANADAGTIASGDTVYFNDVLSVVYAPADGYAIETSGETEITVTDNIDTDNIYASATPLARTYNVVYKSVNGTDLGGTTVTHDFGTTNFVYAAIRDGYDMPVRQEVAWDAEEKTITFLYKPKTVDNSSFSGRVSTDPNIDYSVTVEYQNRTATSVQYRVKWTSIIRSGSWTVYGNKFKASHSNGATTGNISVISAGTWSSQVYYDRSGTGTSGWITVPLSTTNATSFALSVYWWQVNYNDLDMNSYDGTEALRTTWTINVPAY